MWNKYEIVQYEVQFSILLLLFVIRIYHNVPIDMNGKLLPFQRKIHVKSLNENLFPWKTIWFYESDLKFFGRDCK